MKELIDRTFQHFNARELKEAAAAWRDHKGKMLVSLGGAMSTAEIGRSLAPLIRRGKVHAISCTGANLEEDLFQLLGANKPLTKSYRSLTDEEDTAIYNSGHARVTDTVIDEEVITKVVFALLDVWREFTGSGKSVFPHEFFFELFSRSVFAFDESRLEDSWLYAAYQYNIPIFTPGWEDSSCGNELVAFHMEGQCSMSVVKSGVESFKALAEWYRDNCALGVGFFQVGGGIAGDFAICVVPMMRDSLEWDVPMWTYFAQIGDSTTSYGSYSGAPPNEKITWGKLTAETPRFMIESDATICFPLIAAYVME